MNTAAPNDTVAFTGTLSADSVIWASAPFTPPGAPAGSPQMKWIAVGRAAGNAWTGTAVTMIAGHRQRGAEQPLDGDPHVAEAGGPPETTRAGTVCRPFVVPNLRRGMV